MSEQLPPETPENKILFIKMYAAQRQLKEVWTWLARYGLKPDGIASPAVALDLFMGSLRAAIISPEMWDELKAERDEARARVAELEVAVKSAIEFVNMVGEHSPVEFGSTAYVYEALQDVLKGKAK